MLPFISTTPRFCAWSPQTARGKLPPAAVRSCTAAKYSNRGPLASAVRTATRPPRRSVPADAARTAETPDRPGPPPHPAADDSVSQDHPQQRQGRLRVAEHGRSQAQRAGQLQLSLDRREAPGGTPGRPPTTPPTPAPPTAPATAPSAAPPTGRTPHRPRACRRPALPPHRYLPPPHRSPGTAAGHIRRRRHRTTGGSPGPSPAHTAVSSFRNPIEKRMRNYSYRLDSRRRNVVDRSSCDLLVRGRRLPQPHFRQSSRTACRT